MEALAAEARLGMESVRLVAWWSVVPTVLGVGPVDRWRSSLSSGGARSGVAALGRARSEAAAPVAWQQPQAELAAGQQLKPHSNGVAVASGGARDGSLATWWSSERQLLAEEARGGAVEGSTQLML
jgi:hypothetical protein